MTAETFLKGYKQSPDDIDTDESIKTFHDKMARGLQGNGGMPMIPTYIMNADRSKIVSGRKRIIIDAGGTNFRSATGYFDADGNAVIENLQKTVMPASDCVLTKQQFYERIARNIERLLPLADDIGFCFSYQVNMRPDIDGTVVMFSKEVRAPEVIGTEVGAETLAACRAIDGKSGRKIAVLNDTVATLLGGMACSKQQYSAYLGYIYGTGTNVCYIEDTANIAKVQGLPAGKMLINTECGNFDGFVRGKFDRAVSDRTAVPDKQLFEKATGGKYLAEIIAEALRTALDDGVFGGDVHLQPFALKNVSEFVTGGGFPCTFECESDRLFAMDVCNLLVERAAKMGAIVNAALAIASCRDKSLPVAIVAEGTTFNKLAGYRGAFEKYLTQILGDYGITYAIVQGEDLNLVGTLMATTVL